ncbi:unnamed protein product [Paramecium octaurelia]|uniref:Histidine phosphatase family (Branch 2) protein n=1 Tax=Paramecium octaurelia TaxID=43137 RepID=A0A8S1VKU4_PAROT|nr:unnamed protein product [Paramecium octaurelia]
MFNIVLLVVLALMVQADKLVQIQALWRHGARTPIFCNWNCMYFRKQEMLEGYLTPTGMRQHYVLGQWMRDRYIVKNKLLSDTFNAQEITIYATDVNRTIMSAMSNFQGMYSNNGPNVPNVEESFLKPPNPDAKPDEDIGKSAIKYNIQVLPVHMRAAMTDIQLRAYGAPQCAQAAKFQIENQHTQLVKNVSEKAHDTIIQFCNEMNIDPHNFTIFNLSEYMDTFYSSIYNDYPMPENLKKETYEKADAAYSMTIALKLYQTWKQITTQSAPFFDQLFAYTEQALSKEENVKSFKYVVYSAHDVTVQLVASALNITSAECMAQVYLGQEVQNKNCIYTYPGFASNIIWELWQEETTNEPYFKILYNGTEMNLCNKNSTKCMYKEFKELILAQKGDFEKDCDIEIEPIIEYRVPVWMTTLTIIFIVIIVGFCFYGVYLYKQIRQDKTLLSQNL